MGQELLYLISILVSIPALIVMAATMFTPMWTCLKGRISGRPTYFDAENRSFRTPHKIQAGLEFFKIGKEEVMIAHNPIATEKVSFGEFGILYPSQSAAVHPKTPKLITELRGKGFKDITEAQVALGLHHLKNEYPDIDPLDAKTYYDVTDSYGNTQKVNGMQFFMAEMEEAGVYPFAISAKEIKKILSKELDTQVEEIERPLRSCIDYVGLEMRPAAISNWVNESVNMAKNESLLGKLKQNAFNIVALVMLAMVAVIGIYMMQKGGGIDALMGAKTTATTLVQM